TGYFHTLRCEIETALDAASQFGTGCPERLREAVRYSLLAPGKRLRPVLTLAACGLFDADRSNAMPAACAVEMIHCYSLIHDDLPAMDNDDLRRGIPTCHKKFDEATAILAGDALLTGAFEMLDGRFCKELAAAAGACNLIGGQMDDIYSHKQKTGIGFLEHIHQRKTGALIRLALKLGGHIAGASDIHLDILDRYGQYFGLAFQITDDLLDVLGDESAAGKRLRKDAAAGKLTYPRLLGIDGAKKAAAQTIADAEKTLDGLDVRRQTQPLRLLYDLVHQLADRIY
ncbi:MAG: polyprenyl synthetase family protein, partial [Planctomycetaceae bacterium]|nr:polyprenyl synthetase family protein [Planctomycetaceae bacterium]